MTERTSNPPETAREEDYRDYDKRNIGEGWPYGDEDGLPADRNAPYGGTGSNFDESGHVGVEIAGSPEIASHGGPALSPAGEEDAITDDVLEERVTDIVAAKENFDIDLLTITVHDGVVTLSGKVETARDRSLAQTVALATPGVRGCVNRLVLIGVDSHIPSDSDV